MNDKKDLLQAYQGGKKMPKTINRNQLFQLITNSNQKPIIIDIREPHEYAAYHLPTAINIPYQTLVMYPEHYLKANTTYFLICESGSESYRASMMLEPLGYRVVSVEGGYYSIRYR